MGLDIRVPIGSLFALLGMLLAAYGIWSNPAIYGRSLGLDINLWWGVVLLVFGLAMLGLAWRAAVIRRRATRTRGSAAARDAA